MQQAWPISGEAVLTRRLDVRRRHVLAGRVDDELLLAVDDLEVAVLVELADVAGVQPAVGVDRLGGLLGLVAVAPPMTTSERISTSPSSASLISTPATGGPTVPILILSGGLTRAGAAGLGHAPQLGRAACRWRGRTRSPRRGVGRRADVDRDDLVEAEHRAHLREHLSSALAARLGELGGDRLAGLLEPDLLDRRVEMLAFVGACGSKTPPIIVSRPPSASPRSAAPRRTTSAGPRAGRR